ncbi:sulfotransferase domain-containing protein [Zavarzinia sp. CC-PAN008]|uniref:sulfotransferase domain-containing protein n=1 Tax=Zavarzinia sp. CC-PAN008 TaxID=3243332 RepID=UPI003F747B6E
MGALLWLASYPKSGNTWLRAFLHNLLMNPDVPVPPNQMTRFALSDTHKAWYRAANNGQPVDQPSSDVLASLRVSAQRAMTQASRDTVFVKTHALNADYHGVPLIVPQVTAGAIYVVRNPLDVALSVVPHYGLPLDQAIERLALVTGGSAEDPENVPQLISSWSAHVESWTARPSPQLHVVRYEDMIDKAFATFQGIARFLGLDPPRDRLQKAIRFSSFRTLQQLEATHGFTERSPTAERFFREGRSEQWRSQLSKDQVARIVADHRDQMTRFGYVPPGY